MIRRLLTISTNSSFFLFGARGSGKTRLLDQLFGAGQPLVIDLLLPRLYQQLLADPEALTGMIEPAINSGRRIIIDEVQKIPALLDLVHYHIEKSGALFGLTGSSARKLRRGGANLLAGRAVTYNLYPLLEKEIGEQFNLPRALSFGTLPQPYTQGSDDERRLFLESYVDTYLTQEVIAEQAVRNLPPFRRFLSVAAQCNGKIINYSAIARDCQTDPSNVKSYYQILEDTLIGFYLPSFHRSVRKQQIRAPKFYLFDTGVARALSGTVSNLCQPGTSDWGITFEAFIITQIQAALSYKRARASLSFLEVSGGGEVDLIIERTGQPTLCVEIKSGTILHPGELGAQRKITQSITNAKALCLYAGQLPLRHDGVDVLPYREGIAEIVGF